MARTTTPLTDTKVKGLKPTDKTYTEFDGGGLYLEVHTNGGKYWRFKYSFNGKSMRKSLGVYPDTTLANARDKRDRARGLVANGIDPFPPKEKAVVGGLVKNDWDSQFKLYKKYKKEIKDNGLTTAKRLAVQQRIENVSKKLFSTHTTFEQWGEWYLYGQYEIRKEDEGRDKKIGLSVAHLERVENGWTNDVFPYIGNKAMDAVTNGDVVKLIRTMNDRGAKESAKKVYGSINRLYSIALANFPDEVANNPCNIKLSDILGKPATKNYHVITDKKELKALLIAIDNHDTPVPGKKVGSSSVKGALQLLSYVFVRPGNVRSAKWSEVDLDKKQWVIPASKMKTKKELVIPLATQVVDMLSEWKLEAKSDLMFPSPRGINSEMSTAALVQALRSMKYSDTPIVAHSFRGIFSTIAHESNKFNHDAIETQLAHSVGSSVSQAYNRATHLEERIKIMQWYADYLDEVKK